ncbi:MAG: hypothetical protein ACRENV_08810, partial [Candidatus Dormibacteria bacterium]
MAFVDKVAAATKAHLHDIIYVSSDSMQPGLDQRDQSWSGFVNGRYGGCQTSHTSYIGPRSAGVVSPAMSGGWSGGWSLCERSIPGDPARNQIELVDLIHNRYEIGTEPSLVRGSAATQIRQQEAQMRHEQASGQLHSAGLTSVDGH